MPGAPDTVPNADAFQQRLSRLLEQRDPRRAERPDGDDLDDRPPANHATEGADTTEPVGTGDYVIGRHDCLSSIAAETGHLWETIWDDAANAILRDVREDPNVLATGDRLTIPPLRQKTEPGQTEVRHRFERIGQPTMFRLRLAENDVPLAGLPFEIRFQDGSTHSNVTNQQGLLRCPIPSRVEDGTLRVGTGDQVRTYHLHFGRIEPIGLLLGVQQRLRNLGYDCPEHGTLCPETRDALFEYQRKRGLAVTGTATPETRDALRTEHGC